ncbi:hypothetical protein HBH98_246940 [Parastagonospora nodorum]|nr:hypothetical protein HBH53_250920 [Parastagonospora nodorum]KAH3956047.1 hypothetical protein HBH51_257210 [Parastagonospora nodorum]KAH4215311.1 hypothetical protein HBI06_257060 [Parastagonospora nodorum]KAH4222102.1 hypothetical protein HBI05_254960 [Parastagonospora nodorum]KAH4333537.1 hypothetical protein HBH98_246940 [Parastagonospora nodorum]
MTQQIIEMEGRMTISMVNQLKGKALEDHLSWELDLPDLIGLEAILIKAARSFKEKDSIESEPNGEVWVFVGRQVLYRPEMEKQLLSKFIDEYVEL